MSFVDLATLTLHRRHELESRTHIFDEKCDLAIADIKNLKMKAKGFLSELNCDPSELKERFLSVMQRLDEYIYLITDFNLAMAQTADTDSTENAPVQGTPIQPPSLSPFNLLDALSEPLTIACPALHTPALHTTRDQQQLIVFSSSSSAENVPQSPEQQCRIEDEAGEEPSQPDPVPGPVAQQTHRECCITAAQTVLEIDHEYPATIVSANSCSFWVITEDTFKVATFMSEMTEYYKARRSHVSGAQLEQMTYCAYCDDGVFYRAMFLQKPEVDKSTVNVYVIDTGEERVASLESVQPLTKEFCDLPPYARLCHLAGLDFGENMNNKTLLQQQYEFMNKYSGVQCNILVDDNSSESLGVYVILPSQDTTLNELMIEHGLAIPIDKPFQAGRERSKPEAIPTSVARGPPTDSTDWSITECPEYEDPVVAVTGYHNRDEADICKHYKGGPEKTCFKGSRCNKKHILHHPGLSMDQFSESEKSIENYACSYRSIVEELTDGWTLDKMAVVARCAPAALPAPGSWLRVYVTAVCHFDRLFVQIVMETEPEDIPEFGMVLPPKNLAALQRDMNSLATKQAYKPLVIAPAFGEIVAAVYPPDNCWYRAKVLTVTRLDQCVEVMYVDFGTVLWVKEDLIRQLEPRFAALPLQAVQCVLAGVRAGPSAQSEQWARAKRALADLAQDRELDAHVIAREYDEIIVELFACEDSDDLTCGQSVAERLAERGLVDLVEYQVENDDVTQKLVVP